MYQLGIFENSVSSSNTIIEGTSRRVRYIDVFALQDTIGHQGKGEVKTVRVQGWEDVESDKGVPKFSFPSKSTSRQVLHNSSLHWPIFLVEP